MKVAVIHHVNAEHLAVLALPLLDVLLCHPTVVGVGARVFLFFHSLVF